MLNTLGSLLVGIVPMVLVIGAYCFLFEDIADFCFRFLFVRLSLWKHLDKYGEFFLMQFIQCTIAPVVVTAILEEAVYLFSGFRSEGPPIWIWINLCRGFDRVIGHLSLVNTYADAVEKTKDEVAGMQKNGDDAGAAVATRKWSSSDDDGGVAQREAAGRAESYDAREAVAAAVERRIDSRGPISVSDDDSIVVSVASDVSVVYVGRYINIHCDMWGWVAGVFYTSVLGYDKRVVIR